jgi:hypothetical protein
MVTKLYRVRSTQDDGTEIIWVATRNEPPVPYTEAVKGLSAEIEAGDRVREAVDELFTHEEAQRWVEYLRRHYPGLTSNIVEVALPLEQAAEALSYSSSERMRQERKKADYPFSDFEVHRYVAYSPTS